MYPHRTYLVNNTFKYQMNKSSQQPILQWQKHKQAIVLAYTCARGLSSRVTQVQYPIRTHNHKCFILRRSEEPPP